MNYLLDIPQKCSVMTSRSLRKCTPGTMNTAHMRAPPTSCPHPAVLVLWSGGASRMEMGMAMGMGTVCMAFACVRTWGMSNSCQLFLLQFPFMCLLPDLTWDSARWGSVGGSLAALGGCPASGLCSHPCRTLQAPSAILRHAPPPCSFILHTSVHM